MVTGRTVMNMQETLIMNKRKIVAITEARITYTVGSDENISRQLGNLAGKFWAALNNNYLKTRQAALA